MRIFVGQSVRPYVFVTFLQAQRRNETLLVLGISLGASAVYSVVSIIARLTAETPLSQQTARLNTPLSPRPLLDLTYQLLGIFFALVPVMFAIHLLNRNPGGARGLLGLDRPRWMDLGGGVVLAAAIGIPGLGLYLAARELGVNTTVAAANLGAYWWSIPVLILAAIENAMVEEIIVVGYLVTRLRELQWSVPLVIAASAILRGTYHVYQGFGAFLGNAVMGIIFALVYIRWRRTGPLIVAHTLLDVVAFVGYTLLADRLDWI